MSSGARTAKMGKIGEDNYPIQLRDSDEGDEYEEMRQLETLPYSDVLEQFGEDGYNNSNKHLESSVSEAGMG